MIFSTVKIDYNIIVNISLNNYYLFILYVKKLLLLLLSYKNIN